MNQWCNQKVMSNHAMKAVVRSGAAGAKAILAGIAACSVFACSGAGGSDATVSDSDELPPMFVGNIQGSNAGGGPPSGVAPMEEGFFDDDSPQVPSNTGCGPNLTGVLRDFQASHPDFGDAVADDRGLVQHLLGADRKPVYAPAGTTVTTSGAVNFNQWYRDTPGVNQTVEFTLPFAPGVNGISTYDNPNFFPLDAQLYGNEYQDHNYHFTFELHTEFAYRGGEIFTFAGDDDLFIFINGKLVIDLGGVHSTQTDSVNLDEEAQTLGIVVGGSYPLDLFQAERHANGSTFRVDTSLRFTSCGTIILR